MADPEIVIASDHGGFNLKTHIKEFLSTNGYNVADFGADSESSVHYPDYAVKVARALSEGKFPRAVLICGTGIGMSIVANKFPGVRGALCHNLFTARMSREHNDSNILILGGRVLNLIDAEGIVLTWLNTEFVGGRHQERLDMISDIEKGKL